MIDDYFATAHELVRSGKAFATATVVRADKPSSGKPGDRAIVTADGVMHGWIGGSCAQPTVIEQAMVALSEGEARFIRLSTEPKEHGERNGLIDLPMTCFSGGTLEIYIEPQEPRPRLLIVGTLPVAQALARLGGAMKYHVVLVDLDDTGAGEGFADELITRIDDLADHVQRPSTYAVVATHGNYDEPALERILTTGTGYAGLVASPNRAAAVRERLVERGVSDAQLQRLKAPAGLDIQARRGDEIALSIMAEIVQRRRNAEGRSSHTMPAAESDRTASGRDAGTGANSDAGSGAIIDILSEPGSQATFETGAAADGATGPRVDDEIFEIPEIASTARAANRVEVARTNGTAVDPICGMTVNAATARFTHEHAGTIYYFCCGGCQSRFAKEPTAFLS